MIKRGNFYYRRGFIEGGLKTDNRKGVISVFPIIDKRETGINLRRIMDRHGISVKDVQDYLGLASAQSIYAWLNGRNMPSIDNLYALSELLHVSVDTMVCGNRLLWKTKNRREERLFAYYKKIMDRYAA